MQKTWIGVHMIDGLSKRSVVEEANSDHFRVSKISRHSHAHTSLNFQFFFIITLYNLERGSKMLLMKVQEELFFLWFC